MSDDHSTAVIVGGGGHATVLVDTLRCAGGVSIVGYVAPEEGLLSSLGITWLGGDDVRGPLLARGIRSAVMGVGGARSNEVRRQLFEIWLESGFVFADVIHPRAAVSEGAHSAAGLQAMAGSAINIGARLGPNVIVNTNATIEHHCNVGAHVHVAPGATLCGGVVVGAGALIGAAAVVAPGVRIGSDAIVGAGTVVLRDVKDGAKVIGSPARTTDGREGTH